MNFKKNFSELVLAIATVGVLFVSFSNIASAATLQTIRTGTFNNAARTVLSFDKLPIYSVAVEGNVLSLNFKGEIDSKSLQDIVLKDPDIQDLGMAKLGDNENVFTITYGKDITVYKIFDLSNPARIVIDKKSDLKAAVSESKVTKPETQKEKPKAPIKEKASATAVVPVKAETSKVTANNTTSGKANIVIPTNQPKVIDTPNGKVILHRLGDSGATSTKSESTEVSPR